MRKGEKQTAVEWIEEVIDKRHMGSFLKSLIEKAKEMEKQQIEDAYSNGRVDEQFKGTGASFYITKAEQYYNETYKKL